MLLIYFEHKLGKPALFWNIIGTNSENSHFFYCSNFECWKRLLKFNLLVSAFEATTWRSNRSQHVHHALIFFFCTDHECKSRCHFDAGLANCAKRACMLLSIYCLMVIMCNTFGFHRHSRWLYIQQQSSSVVFQQSFYWTRRFDPKTRAFFGYTSKLSKPWG